MYIWMGVCDISYSKFFTNEGRKRFSIWSFFINLSDVNDSLHNIAPNQRVFITVLVKYVDFYVRPSSAQFNDQIL